MAAICTNPYFVVEIFRMGRDMPQWAHLAIDLKARWKWKIEQTRWRRLGFPVYAMNWTDPKTGDVTKGFKELGFMPEAFINLLAMLGWNDGTDQELFH